MASISTDADGNRSIQFFGKDKRRRTIRLGKMALRTVQEIKTRVEYLNSAIVAGQSPDLETLNWLNKIGDGLFEKLVTADLVAARHSAKLKPFLDEMLARRQDVKPATKVIWGHCVRNLIDFFGANKPLSAIGEAEALDFKAYLVNEPDSGQKRSGKRKPTKLAATTVCKRLQFARTFFHDARRRKLIALNPFAEVGHKAAAPRERQAYITEDDARKLLDAADPTWRTIIALSRFGGLRCPSEVLSVKWADVDFVAERITVTSPKTEHHAGKDRRVIPLFPELKQILEDAFEAAPVGAVHVVDSTYREAANGPEGWRSVNMRTQFKRIIKRAGLKPWPRLFHNLRASRETDLMKAHPIHTVTAWIGNTPTIALKHYLQVTDADFDKATGKSAAESRAVEMQNRVQQGMLHDAADRTNPTEGLVERELVPSVATAGNYRTNMQTEREGFEPSPNSPRESAIPEKGAAKACALSLDSIVEALDGLSDVDRALLVRRLSPP